MKTRSTRKCVRCYVVKKILQSNAELLVVVAFAFAAFWLSKLLIAGIKWFERNYPYIALGLALGMLWMCFSVAIMKCTRWIRKLVVEARRECGE